MFVLFIFYKVMLKKKINKKLLFKKNKSNLWVMIRVIVLNATFNNILAISWRSV